MNKFKILGSGLDLSTLDYKTDLKLFSFDFWVTSLRSGNDHLYKLPPNGNLIVIVDFLDGVATALESHLKQIGRTKIDLLLIPPKDNYSKLIDLLDLDLIGGVGIFNPKDSEELTKSYTLLQSIIRPQYVGINLSPIEFKYDIIKKCEELELDLLSFNPFGGKLNYQRLIDSFSVPYLLNFSSTYSSVIFLSSRDIITSQVESSYLSSLIGKETSSIYKLEKNVINLVKPLKKLVNTSLSLENGDIEYTNPHLISFPDDIKFSLGGELKTTIKSDSPGDPFFDNFSNYIESVCKYPEDGDNIDYATILRYKTIESLQSILKPNDPPLDIIKIDLKTFIFNLKNKYYLLTIKNYLPVFSEINEIPIG